ncbi:MAG: glycerate kinase [Pontibacterium sp.]
MKVLIAPDSFKESLSAMGVASAIEQGLAEVISPLEVIKLPVADGGEGTVEAMVAGMGGEIVPCTVTGPLGKPVEAFYGAINGGETAIVEMAAASGLDLLTPEERNPLVATTYGLGELMLHAMDRGARNFIIGLGGSATNDAGAGMLQALGVKLLDKDGNEISRGGAALAQVETIDATGLDVRFTEVDIHVACDVDNPLVGKRGATYVFGPQKGADEAMLAELEASLTHFGHVLEASTNKSVMELEGAGAAGGLGAALVAVLSAELKRGIDIVLEAVEMKSRLEGCDLVITGEGRMDSQSVYGKAPVGVAKLAKAQGIPVVALVGSLGQGYEAVYDAGIDAVFSVVPGVVTLPEALAEAEVNLKGVARNLATSLQLLSR